MPKLIHTVDELIEANGGRSAMVAESEDGIRRLLPTGAVVVVDGGEVVFYPPPTNDHDKLTLQRKYHSIVLEKTESDFYRVRAALTGEGDPVHESTLFTRGIPADGTAALNYLRRAVIDARERIAGINAAIAATPEEVDRRRRAEAVEAARLVAWQEEAARRAEAAAVTI